MADKKPKDAAYVVVNPRGIPDGVPVISIDDGKDYVAGDAYDGPDADAFRAECLLKTQAEIDAEAVEDKLDIEEAEAAMRERTPESLIPWDDLKREPDPPTEIIETGDLVTQGDTGEPLDLHEGEEA